MSETKKAPAAVAAAGGEAPPSPAAATFAVRAGDRLLVTFADGRTDYLAVTTSATETFASVAYPIQVLLGGTAVRVTLPDGRVFEAPA